MPKPILVRCRHCGGSGKSHLPSFLEQTLREVSAMRGTTADQLVKRLKWKGERSAMNQRLEDLRRLGLLVRERQGRNFFYTPVK